MNYFIKMLAALCIPFIALSVQSQQSRENIQVQSTPLGQGLYMFKGAGGNVAVSTGEDGVLIVDDQYADMTAKIDAAIARITDAPLRYVVNTHWHWDHTGGNENYGRSGKTIIAHENTYARMSSDQHLDAINFEWDQPASPKVALPVITYNDIATIRFNDLTIRMIHVPNAHTDSDALIHFVEANVVHAGDVYVTVTYPFIDSSTGGSLDGEIAALEKLSSMIDDETIVIPGHGKISNKDGVVKTLAMLKGMKTIVEKAIANGKTLQQFLESDPTSDYDAEFERVQGQGKVFAHRLYRDLSQ